MSQTKAQLLDPQGDFTLTGQLIGVGATFSGNVSIAGTLTKQDVTNVDAVGLITARSGINVTGGNVFIGQGGSGANNAELKLQAGAGTGNDIIAFLNQAGTTKGNITYDTDHNFLLFNTDGAERARIGSSGLAQFKVDASKAAATQVRLENNAQVGVGTLPDIAVLGYASGGAQKASIRAAVYGEGWMSFHNNNDSEKLRITAGGQISQGTTTPRERVHFHYDSSDENYLRFTNSTTGTGGADGFNIGLNSAEQALIWNKENTSMLFGTNGSTALTITNSQNATFAGTITANNKVTCDNGSGSGYLSADGGSTKVGSFSNHRLDLVINNTQKAKLETNGNFTVTSGTVSDSVGDVRKLGYTSTSSAYTLLQSDNGKFIEMGGGGVTAPSGMDAGTMITIINVAASDQTITQGSSFTLTNSADASTGNRTLASKGMATILFTGSANGFISGSGLS